MRRIGDCNKCGQCCEIEKDWSLFLAPLGEYPKEVTSCCPNLLGQEGDEIRMCGIYESDFWFWDIYCSSFPQKESIPMNVVLLFRNCPSCSYEYIED